jgi:putative glutamine amidotransferase
VKILISWKGKSERYADSISKAEAVPVLQNEKIHWEEISGVVFTGGSDIDPLRYGEERYGRDLEIDEKRDRVEFEIAKNAFLLELPVLGICRGCQLINVFLGGKLFQHIEGHGKIGGKDSFHEVEVSERTDLFGIVNRKNLRVNSAHHQAIKLLGKGLKASAMAPDGIMEGIESSEYPLLGVQWHPERLGDESSEKIFSFFVRELCSKQ